MLYISLIVPLVLSIVLATYIIPRILVVSVKKDLVIPSETRSKGRLRVPRLGGVSLFPILIISVGATAVILLSFFDQLFLEGEDKTSFVQYMFGLAGLTTMYLLTMKRLIRQKTSKDNLLMVLRLKALSLSWINFHKVA